MKIEIGKQYRLSTPPEKIVKNIHRFEEMLVRVVGVYESPTGSGEEMYYVTSEGLYGKELSMPYRLHPVEQTIENYEIF